MNIISSPTFLLHCIGNIGTKLRVYISEKSNTKKDLTQRCLNATNYITHKHPSIHKKSSCVFGSFRIKHYPRATDEAAVCQSIVNNELILYLQPIVNPNGKIVAAEALARLYDDNIGFIPPDTFIRIAESNGLICQLGEQMLCKLCTAISNNKRLSKLSFISINISSTQCMQNDLADRFYAIVQKYGIPPHKIHCEITETRSIESFPTVRKNLLKLKSYGFSIALDDFGSGYANFCYLTSLPFEYVKFDKKVLYDSLADPRHKALFLGLNNLFKQLHIRTICEGIETTTQRNFATSVGVHLHQGYLYSKPVDVESFIKLKRVL